MIRMTVYRAAGIFFILLSFAGLRAETGYKLWLRYERVKDERQLEMITGILNNICIRDSSPTFGVIRNELMLACTGFTGKAPSFTPVLSGGVTLSVAAGSGDPAVQQTGIAGSLESLGPDGFFIGNVILKGTRILVIAGNTPVGALYGTFHLLRLLQTGKSLPVLPVISSPKIQLRILDHWDNPDRTVERGYAGFSIWDWPRLPGYIDPRYIDYARANASIGINGTVLTNVNADARILTPQFLTRVAALADVFRPYGIRVYLTARFSAPVELGGLSTADPLDPAVQKWWKQKSDEIYRLIPDFGGFLVKANSEGQPGPQDYGRSHADGANMLADALAPHGGVVMWRAFVYSAEVPDDRAKQAYNEFKPLDGSFRDNVFIQVKNGPIDFQPREPFHPLFGAMPQTPLALEFQITQEYLGQGTHLVYLAPLFRECLTADTYVRGEGSTVAKVIDGSLDHHERSAIAGVSNIGTAFNWTGHLFGQANWYAFGRLAWNHELTSEAIAAEWIPQTFGNDPGLRKTILEIMMESREAAVNYMTPLGLHHIMGSGHHYGPGPWVSGGRPDWTAIYYHRADTAGIGFDRTATGSNALGQYAPEVREEFKDPETCPDKYLLWFHHLPWDFTMKSGNTLWTELCLTYDKGVKTVDTLNALWATLQGKIDTERYDQVSAFLRIQQEEARWWRNACLLYFRQFSRMPFPNEIEQPEGRLEDYEKMEFPYAPGI